MKALRCGPLVMSLLATTITGAHAAWISLCPGDTPAPAAAKLLAVYSDTAGRRIQLLASADEQPGCATRMVPLEPAQIVWAGLVAGDVVAALGDGVILQGIQTPEGLKVSEILPLQEPRRPSAVPNAPVDADLLSRLDAAAFGIEERASVTSSGKTQLAVECRAGSRPAGVVLKSRGWAVPRGADVAVSLQYRASSPFTVGISDRERLIREEPQIIGTLESARSVASFSLPVTEPGNDVAWSLLCPQQSARIEINGLRIVADKRGTRIPARAMWAWRPQWWTDDAARLFETLRDGGADTVYITIPTLDRPLRIERPDALQRFVAEASSRGIKVWAVDGDPQAVLPEGRNDYVRRARLYSDYNRNVAADSRLHGVQYDIEPYLMPGYQLAPADWLARYLEAIAAFKAELSMPLELAVPFWWSDQVYAGSPLLDRLGLYADSLAVMNYSTNPESIRDRAAPFLAWSSRFKRTVRIALEAGPIENEERRYYRKSGAGELWQVALPGHTILVLLNGATPNPAGPAFSFSRAAIAPGNRISFAGDTQKMFELLPVLEKSWSAWPGFSGMALHGLLP